MVHNIVSFKKNLDTSFILFTFASLYGINYDKEHYSMKTKSEIMARLRQSIAKKKAWLEKSDEELSRIYAERHGTPIVVG